MAAQRLQVFGAVQVASSQVWPRASPSVRPQREQVFAVVQSASVQVWPRDSPSAASHLVQRFASVQVASCHSCRQEQPASRAVQSRRTSKIGIVFLIEVPSFFSGNCLAQIPSSLAALRCLRIFWRSSPWDQASSSSSVRSFSLGTRAGLSFSSRATIIKWALLIRSRSP